MKKIYQCDRCQFNAHSEYLVCAVHPEGIDGEGTHIKDNRCIDFLRDPNIKELWTAIGFEFIDRQLYKKPIVYIQD
jgi:hypothetical protein